MVHLMFFGEAYSGDFVSSSTGRTFWLGLIRANLAGADKEEVQMQSLDPQFALNELIQAIRSFKPDGPIERAVLQRTKNRAEIELGNLRNVDHDYEQRIIAKQLSGHIELANLTLAQK
jgi:hypothetical protein